MSIGGMFQLGFLEIGMDSDWKELSELGKMMLMMIPK